MRKQAYTLLIAVCCFTLAASLALAGPKKMDRPHRFGSLDRGLVAVSSPADGHSWSAWAYRNGAEYDVAVATTDDAGFWSEPVLFGSDDGANQLEPALAAGAAGEVFLVYAERPNRRLMFSWMNPATGAWSVPQPLVVGERVASPAVKILGDRIVVAYLSGRDVELLDFPKPAAAFGTDGVQDGPDPFGDEEDDMDDKEDSEEDSEGDPQDPDYVRPIGRGSSDSGS